MVEVSLKEFLTMDELSQYLNIRKSTLYSMVEKGEIPSFRFGRLLRFKKQEIDIWIECHREETIDSDKKAKEILKGVRSPKMDINKTVKKVIEEVKNNGYTLNHGRPDRIKGLREEVPYGAL
jgi:excisionase family DNA binding protein